MDENRSGGCFLNVFIGVIRRTVSIVRWRPCPLVNGDKGGCHHVSESLAFFLVVAAADSVLPLNAEYLSHVSSSLSHGTYITRSTHKINISYPI
jgi:hypothetical protein